MKLICPDENLPIPLRESNDKLRKKMEGML